MSNGWKNVLLNYAPDINMDQLLNGILLVDKPAGMSSARLVSRIKYLAGAKKAGHAGTLDPFATGLMICCLNKATKLSGFFLNSTKNYEGTLQLGVETDTQDCTGNITSRTDNILFDLDTINAAFKKFTGEIKQVPPVYSALKHKGTPLYKLARKGRPVQKPGRDVFISKLDIIEVSLPEIKFSVTCSAGTYIRTLATDIGRELGCGAHLKQLHRTGCGNFSILNSVSLEEIEALAQSGDIKNSLISMTDALPDIYCCIADNKLAEKIRYGRTIYKNDVNLNDDDLPENSDNNYIRIVNIYDELLAILMHKKNTDSYNYCCVFIDNMGNT